MHVQTIYNNNNTKYYNIKYGQTHCHEIEFTISCTLGFKHKCYSGKFNSLIVFTKGMRQAGKRKDHIIVYIYYILTYDDIYCANPGYDTFICIALYLF